MFRVGNEEMSRFDKGCTIEDEKLGMVEINGSTSGVVCCSFPGSKLRRSSSRD